jgi:hypothetical protein
MTEAGTDPSGKSERQLRSRAGFSYGGMATEYVMHVQMVDALAPNGARFVGHVAYYAPCIARFGDSRQGRRC